MLSQVEREAAMWLPETSANWSDGALDKAGGFGLLPNPNADGLLDKVNDDKLARDVEDLSAIFEELEGGVVDFPLPCDEEEIATGAEVTGDWIGDLEKDVVNVEELSAVFDVLAAEQASALEAAEDEAMESEDDEASDAEDDEGLRPPMVHAAPTWAVQAPLDPRSLIRTPIFKNIDSRIPQISIPRMDLAFGGGPRFSVKPTSGVVPAPSARSVAQLSPKPCKEKIQEAEYHHDPATCWICKSDKSPYKKYALHRYLEKRHRRNWKRGPRYRGRSHVATNRVREGGRFVCTAHWI